MRCIKMVDNRTVIFCCITHGAPVGAGASASVQQVPQLQQMQHKQVSWGSNNTTSSSCSISSRRSSDIVHACNSLATPTAAAAVAAYRRQYLGLDASTTASTATVHQNTHNAKPGFVLKSRPDGMTPRDYGPQHKAGYLPRPTELSEQSAVPNLPCKSGTGVVLPPAQLMPDSCCPPPCSEPLVAMSPDAKAIIAEHQAQRIVAPGSVLNRLVYDSLEAPEPVGSNPAEPWCFSESCSRGSSARTTASGCSTRSNSTVREDTSAAAAAAGTAAAVTTAVYGSHGSALVPWYSPLGPDDPTLLFESRFECGNLRRAVQVCPFEYDLVLQPDINTRGHTQWYYFSVSNVRAGQPYRFNTINLMKPDSLYNMGMLPLMHSEKQMKSKGIGWFRSGCDVCYGPNSIRHGKNQTYFTLSFVIEFPHSDDFVHLAHCYPYSYTDLQNHLYLICKEPSPGIVIQRSALATSLAGNAVDMLTISAPEGSGKPMSKREGVVLSARVHPGETNASWMMKGALQQLLSNSAESAQLREKFVFKVVPMLNPDGVIVGNYRCSLAGLDLNRVWQEPDGRIQPVIQAFKEMIRAFIAEREVALFVDMHGHSRKYGVFCYGCEKKGAKDAVPQAPGWPVPGSVGVLPGVPAKNLERLFPLMLYINAPDLFSFKSCNFKVQKSKAGTGRVVGFRELGLVNAYTMEASFCGASVGKFAKQHFNTGHLEDMGSALVRTLLDYWAPPECSSAGELSAQLLAAGSGSGAAAAAQSAAGLLIDTAAAADEDDPCTDSDDESSDNEEETTATEKVADKPQAVTQLSRKGSTAQGPAAAAAAMDATVAGSAAAAAAATISKNVAQLSNQLVSMLSGSTVAACAAGATGGGRRGAAGTSAADSVVASSSAVAALLTALKGASAPSTVDTAVTAAASAGGSSSNSTRRSSSRNASSQGISSSSSSSTNQPASQIASSAAAAAAAQQLLAKLLAGKSKPGSSSTGLALATRDSTQAPGDAAAESGAVPYLANATSSAQQLQAGTTAAATAVTAGANTLIQAAGLKATVGSYNSTNSSAADASMTVSNASVAIQPGDGQQAAGKSPAQQHIVGSTDSTAALQLTAEEAALANMPGLIDLLQQLVDEHTALTAVVGATTTDGRSAGVATKSSRKKGRQRGLARYGNPEVLRAARAKADASLAAALPELGPMLGDGGEFVLVDANSRPATCTAAFANSSAFASAGLSAAADCTAAGPNCSSNWPACIKSGRRANTAGGKGSSRASALDAERYIDLLDKQKRHTGGVLASSSIDDPWAGSYSSSSVSSSARTTRSAKSTSSFKGNIGGAALGSAAAVAAAGAAAGLGSGLATSKGTLLWGEPVEMHQSSTAVAAAAALAGDPGLGAAASDPMHRAAAGGGGGEPAGGRRRRSKSAHAWFRTDSFDRKVESVQTAVINANPVLQSTNGYACQGNLSGQ